MSTKITYTQQGDYLLPDLKLPEQPTAKIGIWGKRHLKYIEHYRPILYTNLLTRCKLTAYLADIDEQAEDMFFRLVNVFLCNRGIAPARERNDTEGKGTGQKANGAVVTTAYSGSKFAAA